MSSHTFDNLHTASRLAAGMPPLLLEAEKVAHSFMKGLHGRRRVGAGEAFWQFRHYTPGDARRDIDWKQSAKREDVFIRQREWESAQTLWLYRDASESMNFRSSNAVLHKKDYAEILLLALAMVALDGGEQVGLLDADLAPQTGYPSIERIYSHLSHQKNIAETARPVTARSQVLLISDFFFAPDQMYDFCADLSRRGVAGMLLQVCDPAEMDLPYQGRVKFYDIENAAAPAVTLQQVEILRQDYREKFAQHRTGLAAAAASWGWRFHAVTTVDRPENALSSIYLDLAKG